MDTTHGGKFDPAYPETPKAKREYWAVNFSLDKRFANGWLAGFSYTWSRLTGNYSGLASSDELGRAEPYVERYFDLWHMAYDKNMTPIDGPLNTDRPHYAKLFGAYTLPFGLTVGAVVAAAYRHSGYRNLVLPCGDYTWKPFGRGTMGRTPFLWLTNFYAEYSSEVRGRRRSTSTSMSTISSTSRRPRSSPNGEPIGIWKSPMSNCFRETGTSRRRGSGYEPDPALRLKGLHFYPPVSVRLGARFSF